MYFSLLMSLVLVVYLSAGRLADTSWMALHCLSQTLVSVTV